MEKLCIEKKGRYVYGVGAGDREVNLGPIGIDGSEVFTISYGDISAIVHSCSAEPYQSTDDEKVKGWVRAHQGVLDAAGRRLGVVIPLGFDTILKPADGESLPDDVVRDWLRQDYTRLHEVMKKIEGKDEYVVQVSYEPGLLFKRLSGQNAEIEQLARKIEQENAAATPGITYLYRQRLERLVAAETMRLADAWFKDFYARIKRHTDDILVEKTRKLDHARVMLLNLACLVAREKVDGLGKELEEINNEEGFSVHFSGPWPPYSFVDRPSITAIGELNAAQPGLPHHAG
jgi:hypothetical protein